MAVADVSHKPLFQLVPLSGRRAVVPGRARGLGKAIGCRLAAAGAGVALTDVDKSAAEAATADAGKRGRVIGLFADGTDSASVAAAAEAAVQQLGSIDTWVNNAGIYPTKPLVDMRDEDWDRVLNINLRGAFIGSRAAERRMIAAGRGGVIINLSSVAGVKGTDAGTLHYGVSKAGIRGLTRHTALEVAAARETGFDISARLHSLRGRGGVPDDIARAVFFCTSDMAIFMTGRTLLVDAGETA